MCSSLYQPVKNSFNLDIFDLVAFIGIWFIFGKPYMYCTCKWCTLYWRTKTIFKFSIVSEAPKETPKVKKFESFNADTYKTDEQKKEEVSYMYMSPLDPYLSLIIYEDILER